MARKLQSLLRLLSWFYTLFVNALIKRCFCSIQFQGAMIVLDGSPLILAGLYD